MVVIESYFYTKLLICNYLLGKLSTTAFTTSSSDYGKAYGGKFTKLF